MEKSEPPEPCPFTELSPVFNSDLQPLAAPSTTSSPELTPKMVQRGPNQNIAVPPSPALVCPPSLPIPCVTTGECSVKQEKNIATDEAGEAEKQNQNPQSFLSNQPLHASEFASEIAKNCIITGENVAASDSGNFESTDDRSVILTGDHIRFPEFVSPSMMGPSENVSVLDFTDGTCPTQIPDFQRRLNDRQALCETELPRATDRVHKKSPFLDSTLRLFNQIGSDLPPGFHIDNPSVSSFYNFVQGHFNKILEICHVSRFTTSTEHWIQSFVAMYSTTLLPDSISQPIIQALQTFLEVQKNNLPESLAITSLPEGLEIAEIDAKGRLPACLSVRKGCQSYQNCEVILSHLAQIPALSKAVKSIESVYCRMKTWCQSYFQDKNDLEQTVQFWHSLHNLLKFCDDQERKDVLDTLPVYYDHWQSKLTNECHAIFKHIGWYAYKSGEVSQHGGAIFPCAPRVDSSPSSPQFQEDNFVASLGTNLIGHFGPTYLPGTPSPPSPISAGQFAESENWEDPNLTFWAPLTSKELHHYAKRMKILLPFLKEHHMPLSKKYPNLHPFRGDLFLAALYYILQSTKNIAQTIIDKIQSRKFLLTGEELSQASDYAKFFSELCNLEQQRESAISNYIRSATGTLGFLEQNPAPQPAGAPIDIPSPNSLVQIIIQGLSSSPPPFLTPNQKVGNLHLRALLERFIPGENRYQKEYRNVLEALLGPHQEFTGPELLLKLYDCLYDSGNLKQFSELDFTVIREKTENHHRLHPQHPKEKSTNYEGLCPEEKSSKMGDIQSQYPEAESELNSAAKKFVKLLKDLSENYEPLRNVYLFNVLCMFE